MPDKHYYVSKVPLYGKFQKIVRQDRTKLEKFFQAQIEQDPGYFDTLLGTKGFSILKVYQKAFKKIQIRRKFGKIEGRMDF